MDTSQFASKQDLATTKQGLEGAIAKQGTELRSEMKAMEVRIVDSLREVVSDAMQNISQAYERHETRLTSQGATLNRIEAKLDSTVNRVDDHEGRLKRLKKPSRRTKLA